MSFTEPLDAYEYAYVTDPSGRITVTYGGPVDLSSLRTLPEGMTFANSGYVGLHSLTTLPEGVTFNNGGYVYLHSLTTLPEGMTFNNSGYVYLSPGQYHYQGRDIAFRIVDDIPMDIGPYRTVGDYRVAKAWYFKGGDYRGQPNVWIATDGEHYAHGKTIETALRDLRFKIARVNYDAAELIARVKASGIITWADFRLLTGACAEGLQQGLADLGLDPDLPQMPLSQALELVRGKYGEQRMREAFA